MRAVQGFYVIILNVGWVKGYAQCTGSSSKCPQALNKTVTVVRDQKSGHDAQHAYQHIARIGVVIIAYGRLLGQAALRFGKHQQCNGQKYTGKPNKIAQGHVGEHQLVLVLLGTVVDFRIQVIHK